MVAAAEEVETAGNDQYQNRHMDAIFKEGFSFSGFERDYLALNLAGEGFLDISGVSGIDSISDGRGAVFADFDNDGDTDVFLTTVQNEGHFLFRNDVGSHNGFLSVELEGTRSGRDAFGSVVRVKSAVGIQTKVKSGGSGFVSQHDPRLLFGLGDEPQCEWLEVAWPDGQKERFDSIAAGSSILIVQGSGELLSRNEHRFELIDPLSRAETLVARVGVQRGQPFPDVALTTLDGQATTLSDVLQPDKRYLVNIWATYCVPCSQEMPELQKLAPRLAASDIEIVGISIDLDSVEHVAAFLETRGIQYPIFTTDEESVAQIYNRGEVILPTSFLLDGDLRVIEIFPAWSEESRQAVHRLAGVAD